MLSGVPPLEAEGLASEAEDATDADKALAAEKMRGGSRRSCEDLCSAAAYATWYFGSVKDPFGTGAKTASIATRHAVRHHARARHARYRGHHRLGR